MTQKHTTLNRSCFSLRERREINRIGNIEVPDELIDKLPADQRKVFEQAKAIAEQIKKTVPEAAKKPEKKENSENLEKKAQGETKEEAEKRIQKEINAVESVHGQINADEENTVPLTPEFVRAGIATGAVPFAATYLATLGNFPALATSTITGGLGMYAGKKLLPNMPKAGPALGASVGIVSPPILKAIGTALTNNLGSFLTYNSTALSVGAASLYGTAGGVLGHYVSKALGLEKTWLDAGLSGGLAVAGGALGYASNGAALAYIPAGLSLLPVGTAGSLLPFSILGGITAATTGGLFALGKLEGKLLKRSKTNKIIPNVLRGIISPATIPAWLVKGVMDGGVGFIKDQAKGVQNIFTGKGIVHSTIKGITAVPKWAARKTAQVAASPFKGLYNGLTKSPLTEFDKGSGVIGKALRAIPYGAARAARFVTKDTWDYLQSAPSAK